ncbi:hypothetical protein V2J09_006661 [Rumex salicifolius]
MAILPNPLSPRLLLKLLKSQKNSHAALSLFDAATTQRASSYAHTPDVYHYIFRRLSEPRLVGHVSRVLELIRAQRCECSEDVALAAIKAYSKNSMVEQALDVFKRMREVFGCDPGVRSHNSILNCFVESRQWEKAESFLKYFESLDMNPDLDTYNILLKLSCKRGQFDKAKRLLHRMWNQGMSPDVCSYGTLISGFVKSKKVSDALEVFDEMSERGVNPDVICYNILIDGYFKVGDVDKANEVFDRLVRDPLAYPSVVTYNTMINGLCKCGKVVEGVLLWRRMERNERNLDLYTYSSLIHGLCKTGHLDEASKVYASMEENNVCRDVVVCNAMLNGYCQARRIQEAFELWRKMMDDNLYNIVSYNIFLRGLFENGMVDKAISIWERLLCCDFCADSRAFGVVIHGLCKHGYLNMAMSILREAEHSGKPDIYAYSSLINGLCKEGRLDEALSMLDHMLSKGIEANSHVYNALINGFIGAFRIESAIKILEKMAGGGCLPTRFTYNSIINGLCKAERFIDAYKLLREMREKRLQPDRVTYSLLMDGLFQSKNTERALNLWHQALNQGIKPDMTMHNIIIHGLCSAGKVEDAMVLYLKMKGTECTPNLVTHNTLMDGFYKVGDCTKASEIWTLISESSLQPDIISYNIILKGLSSFNRTEDALVFLDEALAKGIVPTLVTWNIVVRAVVFEGVYSTTVSDEPDVRIPRAKVPSDTMPSIYVSRNHKGFGRNVEPLAAQHQQFSPWKQFSFIMKMEKRGGRPLNSEQPIEVVQVSQVKILIRDPPWTPILGRHLCHNSDQKTAQTPHGVGRLIVEELQLSYEGEHLSTAYQKVLRHLPKDRQRDSLKVIIVMLSHHIEPYNLQNCSCDHGEDGDEESNAHSLELCEPSLDFGELPNPWDDQKIVNRGPEDDADRVEYRERCRWDLEIRAHVLIERVSLEDEHRTHLAVHCCKDDPGCPHGKKTN